MAMTKGVMNDAMESSIYICGIDPLDADDRCYNIFICDPYITRLRLALGSKVLRVQDSAKAFEVVLSLRRRF